VTDELRTQIRQLYFVDRVALREIAEQLALSPEAVRAALVLHGGETTPEAPAPAATAMAHTGEASPLIRTAVSRAVAAFRRATQGHR
jgi:hypothetical protein